MKSHQTKAAQFAIAGFSLIVLAISASTSFGFFYQFFDALIPPEILGAGTGALISGAVGVLLFDIACSIWLFTFLHHAGTPEQRAITLIMTAVTFVGSAAASVAHLGLTATGDLAIDPGARGTIALTSLVVVILGVICNFGAALSYQRFSYDNKMQVRESDRLDLIQKAEDEQASELDALVGQQVKELLTQQAPQLAAIQAQRLAAKFYRSETAKYGSDQTNNGTETAPTPSRGQAVSPTPTTNQSSEQKPKRYSMQEYRDGEWRFVTESDDHERITELAQKRGDIYWVSTKVTDWETGKEQIYEVLTENGEPDFLANGQAGD